LKAILLNSHNLFPDGGEEKRKLCEELGADAWIDYTVSQDIVADVKKITDGRGAHAAVVTTASSAGYAQAIDYLRDNGHLMAVGLPGEAKLDASIFFTVFKVRLSYLCLDRSLKFHSCKGITIHGSYVGNRQDAEEAIDIAASGAVKCHYQLKKLSEIEQWVLTLSHLAAYLIYFFRVYNDLTNGKVAGRIVLEVD